MFKFLQTYQCNRCHTVWTSGFFDNRVCPHCNAYFRNAGKFLRRFFGVLALFVALVGLDAWLLDRRFVPALRETALVIADGSDFYEYGQRTYAAELLRGRTRVGGGSSLYSLKKATPLYASPVLSRDRKPYDPIATLAANRVVRLGTVVPEGRRAWYAAEFYEGPKLVRGFAFLPQSLADSFAAYDLGKAKSRAQDRFSEYVKANFKGKTIKAVKDEAVDLADDEGAFVVPELSSKARSYILPWAERKRIEIARAWFLDADELQKAALQNDAEYERAPLVLPEPLSRNYYKLKKSLPFNPDVPADHFNPPAEKLEAARIVRLTAVYWDNLDSWGQVHFYDGAAAAMGYLQLPQDWEKVLASYDPKRERAAALKKFSSYLKANFELQEIAEDPKAAKKTAETRGSFVIDELSGGTLSVAVPLKDKAAVAEARAYYLSDEALDRTITQIDNSYKRPALGSDEEL